MSNYRFINYKTEQCAIVGNLFLTAHVAPRTSEESWVETLDGIATTMGWELEDIVAVSADGLFAYLSLGSIEVRIDFIGSDLKSCSKRFHGLLWDDNHA